MGAPVGGEKDVELISKSVETKTIETKHETPYGGVKWSSELALKDFADPVYDVVDEHILDKKTRSKVSSKSLQILAAPRKRSFEAKKANGGIQQPRK
ncbi:hypothetical protein CRE_13296 [Caenorhabditis remanei]|uniref:Uncharacterized protein n=1 Tax=Caenorhabditis remanei TaxID=31234 RepID=E3M8J6_CAERE|nr:hypothetical protein CRE_13296 [Caenorhabditis remanei]